MVAQALSSQEWGTVAALGAGAATALGSALVFWIRELSNRLIAALMGLAAGVMLSASIFSLLLPAWNLALGFELVAAFALGVGALHAADRFFPQESLASTGDSSAKKQALLLAFAMALHNFPEGLAVGVGFAADAVGDGIGISAAIALQNLPEGLVTALALLAAHFRRSQAFSVVALTGIVEVIGGLVGVFMIPEIQSLVPMTLAFSAGAMIYVVFAELLPESFKPGYRAVAATSCAIGFAVTALLDVYLG